MTDLKTLDNLLNADFDASATISARQFFDRLHQTYSVISKNYPPIDAQFVDASDFDPADFENFLSDDTETHYPYPDTDTFAIIVSTNPDNYQIIHYFNTKTNIAYSTESFPTTQTYANYHHFIADFFDYYIRSAITSDFDHYLTK